MIVWIRVALVTITIVMMQITLFDGLRVSGVAPEIALALAVAAGVTGGSRNGAVVGFVVGSTLDLFLAAPFGLSALSYCLVAYAAGMLANNVSDASWVASAPVVATGTAGGLGLYVLFGEILGQPHFYTSQVWRIILIASTVSLLVAAPLARLMHWVWGTSSRRVMPTRPIGLVN